MIVYNVWAYDPTNLNGISDLKGTFEDKKDADRFARDVYGGDRMFYKVKVIAVTVNMKTG